ncbi:MAG: undecaprenyldiphospho-muramoylpentapeptide beta-N-acetylglucosaminyltransferase [Candidatus Krumholzibacteria bacterium]|nr:undecaprenyldiphospho-muramoylpentapeptide beta-N-acetylglucosaminyltransferase [Candidatus Krumholzibacteria bacterium]
MKSKKGMKLIFAGGGTGGHLYPALAVAELMSARHPGFEALFIGTRSGIEARVVPESGYRIKFISSRGVRGKGFVGKVITMASLMVGIVQASMIISRFKPDLVFGSGGYASAAVIISAFILRKRIVLQEQNSIPGLANRMLAPCAKRIYLGFESAAAWLKGHAGISVTGNPLRTQVSQVVVDAGKDTKAEFGLHGSSPVLLVFGGSQGAASLNRAATRFILENEDIQAIVQTGKKDFERVKNELAPAGSRVYVSSYIKNIYKAYLAADIALARSGALSVSELIAMSLPAIFVPYPWSADDHQVHNARAVVRAGGAKMILDGELNVETLGTVFGDILGVPGKLENMTKALQEMGGRGATEAICDDIEEYMNGAANPGLPENVDEYDGETREGGDDAR